MGAMAESMMAFAQPLLDQGDGSQNHAQFAMMIATVCWNLGITPDAQHDEFLAGIRNATKMNDEEFRVFRQEVIDPMVRRHRRMFPHLDPTQRQMLRNARSSG